MPLICTADDDFILSRQMDHAQAQWLARLASGPTVIQDDGRPGIEPHSAWLRLGKHCQETGDRIVEFWLRFRTHTVRDIMPLNADGYFFAKQAARSLHVRTDTLEFLLVGYLQNETLRVQRWKVPELFMLDEQKRDWRKAGPCLIGKPGTLTSTT